MTMLSLVLARRKARGPEIAGVFSPVALKVSLIPRILSRN